MAARKGGRGNNGEVRDLTIEILKGIRGELVKLREEMHGLREEGHETRNELVKLREETHGLREETHGLREETHGLREEGQETRNELVKLRDATTRGFAVLTRRVDHLVEFSGERWRDHEERLKKIESRLKIA